MAKHVEASGVPKLRFPEFRNGGEWITRSLGDVVTFSSGGTPSKAEPDYWNGDIPWISASSMHEANIAESDLKVTPLAIGQGARIAPRGSLLVLVRGSMLFNRVPMGIALIDVAFNQDVKALKVVSGVDAKFLLGQLIAISPRIPINETGIGAGKIETHTLENLPVFLPQHAEQQKVADCLASLDEVIAAQGRKVEVLKTHKRGLMRQLFPHEGGGCPRLRFSEFRGAPEWRETPLGDLADLQSGYPFDGKDIVENSSGERLMRGINITEGAVRHGAMIDRYFLGSMDGLERFRLRKNDLVIAMDGSKVGKNSALIGDEDVGALLIQRVARLRIESAELMDFIFQQIHSPRFHAYVDRINTSSGIPHISARQIREYPIHSTGEAEQQRIAGCLSSLDTQITAESAQLAALKTHKQGLMQQLFPTLIEG